MALPAAFTAALAAPGLTLDLWLEIEGVPWAFGMTDRASSWFASRAVVAERRAGVLGCFTGIPSGVEQEVRPWDGDSSVGALDVELLDPDDGAVLALVTGAGRTDNVLRLSADLTAAATSFTVTTTPDPTAYPTGGGTVFIGRETITYTSRSGTTFSGCTRTAYRLPGQLDTFTHTAGDWVTPYARFLRTRRATLYVVADGVEANKVARWSGIVSGSAGTRGLTCFRISMESIEAELKRPLFGLQRRAKLVAPVVDGLGGYAGKVDGQPIPDEACLVLDPGSLSGVSWVEGAIYYVRVGDEYFVAKHESAGLARPRLNFLATGCGRGCYGSPQQEHAAGDEVLQVFHVGGRDASGPPEAANSPFTIASDHPLDLLLQVLLSKAGGGVNGTYDTLAENGSGFDQGRIDVQGFQDVKRVWIPGVRHGPERLEERTELKAWMASLLRPHLCYPVQLPDGRLSVRRVQPPIPGAVVRSIDATAVVSPASWESGTGTIVGRLVFKCDYDPTNSSTERGPFGQIYTVEIQGPGCEAQEFYAGQFSELVIESKGQWSGVSSQGLTTDAQEVAFRLSEAARQRLGQPAPIITVECDYSAFDLTVGDLIQLSIANVPDARAGVRGLSGALFELRRKTVDDARGVVTLTLGQATYGTGARMVAPSMRAYGAPTTTSIPVEGNVFSSSGQDADSFAVGDSVSVWSPDLGTLRGTALIAGITPGSGVSTITLGSAVSGIVAGDVILPSGQGTVGATRQSLWAFLAGTAGTFAGGAAGNVYSG